MKIGSPIIVLGSAQKNKYVGSVDSYCSCITAACGMGGGQIPMIVEIYETDDDPIPSRMV